MNRRQLVIMCFFVAWLLWPLLTVTALAGDGTQRIYFSPGDLSFERVKGYDLVRLREAGLLSEPGEPMLPAKNIFVAIPPEWRVDEVEVTLQGGEELSGRFRIFPAQPPQPGSHRDHPDLVEPNPTTSTSSAPYPGKLVECSGSGSLSGHYLAGVRVFPLQYIPSEGKLVLYREIEFRLGLVHADNPPPRIARRTRRAEEMFAQSIRNRVINPEDVIPQVAEDVIELTRNDGMVEYLIITHESLVDQFEILAEWKTKKGVPAAVVTTQSIYANPAYDGYDFQEEIRNCIKDYWQNRGTIWVLLGGDTNYVPVRAAYAYPDPGIPPHDSEDIPCDLYYADLDGTWDPDGDHVYGEPHMDIDMYADVYIGRASVGSQVDALHFVNKTRDYEGGGGEALPTDYQLRMLFIGEKLGDFLYGGDVKDQIDDFCIPHGFTITKLYERDGTLSKSAVRDSLNDGQNMVNTVCHGNTSSICLGYNFQCSEQWTRSDMDALNNSPRVSGFWYSTSDYAGNLEGDCVAEHWLENEDGGGIGFIGNSRNGWFNIWPSSGPSIELDIQFFCDLFINGYHRLGRAHSQAKDYLIPSCHWNDQDRYCLYELNLFGDPELPLWTETPETLQVIHPGSLLVDHASSCTVAVHNGGGPVEGALVCLYKENDVYATDLTNLNGQATFAVLPSDTGLMCVTVTKHNYLPYEGSALVIKSDESFVRGDADANGDHDLFDGLRILYWLGGLADPPPCVNAADAEDDEDVDLFDGLRVIYWIGGAADPPPTPCCDIPDACGTDPTSGPLTCDSFPPCRDLKGGLARGTALIGRAEESQLAVGQGMIEDKTVVVPVTLNNAEPLAGFSCLIEYDHGVLTATAVEKAGLVAEKFDVFAHGVDEPGLVAIAAVSDMDVADGVEKLPAGQHRVARITFELKEKILIHDVPLRVISSVMAMDHRYALNHEAVDGIIKVTSAAPKKFKLKKMVLLK